MDRENQEENQENRQEPPQRPRNFLELENNPPEEIERRIVEQAELPLHRNVLPRPEDEPAPVRANRAARVAAQERRNQENPYYRAGGNGEPPAEGDDQNEPADPLLDIPPEDPAVQGRAEPIMVEIQLDELREQPVAPAPRRRMRGPYQRRAPPLAPAGRVHYQQRARQPPLGVDQAALQRNDFLWMRRNRQNGRRYQARQRVVNPDDALAQQPLPRDDQQENLQLAAENPEPALIFAPQPMLLQDLQLCENAQQRVVDLDEALARQRMLRDDQQQNLQLAPVYQEPDLVFAQQPIPQQDPQLGQNGAQQRVVDPDPGFAQQPRDDQQQNLQPAPEHQEPEEINDPAPVQDPQPGLENPQLDQNAPERAPEPHDPLARQPSPRDEQQENLQLAPKLQESINLEPDQIQLAQDQNLQSEPVVPVPSQSTSTPQPGPSSRNDDVSLPASEQQSSPQPGPSNLEQGNLAHAKAQPSGLLTAIRQLEYLGCIPEVKPGEPEQLLKLPPLAPALLARLKDPPTPGSLASNEYSPAREGAPDDAVASPPGFPREPLPDPNPQMIRVVTPEVERLMAVIAPRFHQAPVMEVEEEEAPLPNPPELLPPIEVDSGHPSSRTTNTTEEDDDVEEVGLPDVPPIEERNAEDGRHVMPFDDDGLPVDEEEVDEAIDDQNDEENIDDDDEAVEQDEGIQRNPLQVHQLPPIQPQQVQQAQVEQPQAGQLRYFQMFAHPFQGSDSSDSEVANILRNSVDPPGGNRDNLQSEPMELTPCLGGIVSPIDEPEPRNLKRSYPQAGCSKDPDEPVVKQLALASTSSRMTPPQPPTIEAPAPQLLVATESDSGESSPEAGCSKDPDEPVVKPIALASTSSRMTPPQPPTEEAPAQQLPESDSGESYLVFSEESAPPQTPSEVPLPSPDSPGSGGDVQAGVEDEPRPPPEQEEAEDLRVLDQELEEQRQMVRMAEQEAQPVEEDMMPPRVIALVRPRRNAGDVILRGLVLQEYIPEGARLFPEGVLGEEEDQQQDQVEEQGGDQEDDEEAQDAGLEGDEQEDQAEEREEVQERAEEEVHDAHDEVEQNQAQPGLDQQRLEQVVDDVQGEEQQGQNVDQGEDQREAEGEPQQPQVDDAQAGPDQDRPEQAQVVEQADDGVQGEAQQGQNVDEQIQDEGEREAEGEAGQPQVDDAEAEPEQAQAVEQVAGGPPRAEQADVGVQGEEQQDRNADEPIQEEDQQEADGEPQQRQIDDAQAGPNRQSPEEAQVVEQVAGNAPRVEQADAGVQGEEQQGQNVDEAIQDEDQQEGHGEDQQEARGEVQQRQIDDAQAEPHRQRPEEAQVVEQVAGNAPRVEQADAGVQGEEQQGQNVDEPIQEEDQQEAHGEHQQEAQGEPQQRQIDDAQAGPNQERPEEARVVEQLAGSAPRVEQADNGVQNEEQQGQNVDEPIQDEDQQEAHGEDQQEAQGEPQQRQIDNAQARPEQERPEQVQVAEAAARVERVDDGIQGERQQGLNVDEPIQHEDQREAQGEAHQLQVDEAQAELDQERPEEAQIAGSVPRVEQADDGVRGDRSRSQNVDEPIQDEDQQEARGEARNVTSELPPDMVIPLLPRINLRTQPKAQQGETRNVENVTDVASRPQMFAASDEEPHGGNGEGIQETVEQVETDEEEEEEEDTDEEKKKQKKITDDHPRKDLDDGDPPTATGACVLAIGPMCSLDSSPDVSPSKVMPKCEYLKPISCLITAAKKQLTAHGSLNVINSEDAEDDKNHEEKTERIEFEDKIDMENEDEE